MKLTIKHIAEMAGVSRGTVDRVIHNRYGVEPDVRNRIQAILSDNAYVPNIAAKALKISQKAIKIGVLVPSSKNVFYIDILAGIEEAKKTFSGYGLVVIEREMPELSPACQVECIDQLLDQGISGLVLAAVDSPEVRARIDAIADTVPTVTYNTDFSASRRICFIGQNHYVAGRVVGDLMAKIVHSSGNVATLISQRNMLAHMQRVQGFEDVIRETRPDLTIMEPLETLEDEQRGYRMVDSLIKTHKNLVGIFVAGGAQQSAGRMLWESGKFDQIRMICCDLLPETVHLVQSGIVSFTIGQDPFLQGYIPIKIMYEYLALGISPQCEQLYTQIDIRTKDNVGMMEPNVFASLYSKL